MSFCIIHYFTVFWGDLNLVCINFIVAFLIFIELVFTEEKDNTFLLKFLKAVLIILTLVLIAIYLIAFFHPNWSVFVPLEFMKNVNISTFILILVLGTFRFLWCTLSVEKRFV